MASRGVPAQWPDEPARRLRLVLRLDAGPHRRRRRGACAQDRREQEVIIRDPGYPDPYGQGTRRRDEIRRRGSSSQSRAELPRWQRTSVGFDHQIRQGLRFNLDSFYEHTSNDFRSLDLNAPVDGVRPDPLSGRMLLVQSIGRSTRTGLNVDLSFSPRPACSAIVRYGYSRTFNDADDALTPPATGTFETEWAPLAAICVIVFNWNIGGSHRLGRDGSMNGRLQSGSPYNITTGRMTIGDAIFNDRPVGVGRNSCAG